MKVVTDGGAAWLKRGKSESFVTENSAALLALDSLLKPKVAYLL